MSTPADSMQAMIDNLPNKTGRSLDEWLQVVSRHDLHRHSDIVTMLKTTHGITHGYANLIASKARDEGGTETDLVAAQYTGSKASLRPIYDAVLTATAVFGGDVEVSPKKTYVSLRRARQFATIKPSTRTRVDLGLNLAGVDPTDRLQPTTGMCSHTIELTSVDDLDAQAVSWLRQAYDRAGTRRKQSSGT